jgi:putative transcriptional regulator
MSLIRVTRPLVLLAALFAFVPVTIFGATQPDTAVPQPPPSLVGQLLVASPDTPDPRYRGAAVVVVRHGPEGGLGIVINRLAGDVPLATLFEIIGEKKDDTVTGTVPIYTGGPVQPEVFFVLHSAEYRRPETTSLTADVATTASRQIFHDIAAKVGPKKYLIAFGYVGWVPGQLEGQMSIRGWATAPLDSELAFDVERGKVWELAAQRLRRAP